MADSQPIPTKKTFQDLTGKVFGEMVVVSYAGPRYVGGMSYWNCVCSCGSERAVSRGSLVVQGQVSCGCKAAEIQMAKRTKHGAAGSRVYKAWFAMKDRCLNQRNPKYKYYGGRGITVCQRWRESYTAFRADMGERPNGMTIDRIDVNGNYEPGNCRWATRSQQQQNLRCTRIIAFNGMSLSITDWATHLGISRVLLRSRLKAGWTVERTLTTPRLSQGCRDNIKALRLRESLENTNGSITERSPSNRERDERPGSEVPSERNGGLRAGTGNQLVLFR